MAWHRQWGAGRMKKEAKSSVIEVDCACEPVTTHSFFFPAIHHSYFITYFITYFIMPRGHEWHHHGIGIGIITINTIVVIFMTAGITVQS